MAAISVLEEGSCALKSGNIVRIRNLFDRLSSEFSDSSDNFLNVADHLKLVNERKGLSRCHEVSWCLPKVIEKDLIPLR